MVEFPGTPCRWVVGLLVPNGAAVNSLGLMGFKRQGPQVLRLQRIGIARTRSRTSTAGKRQSARNRVGAVPEAGPKNITNAPDAPADCFVWVSQRQYRSRSKPVVQPKARNVLEMN